MKSSDQAFPGENPAASHWGNEPRYKPGLSKFEYAAIHIMAGLCADSKRAIGFSHVAKQAVEAAKELEIALNEYDS